MKKKPRNRKPPQKHSVNQLDFDESEEEILSVSCREEDIKQDPGHYEDLWERSENFN